MSPAISPMDAMEVYKRLVRNSDANLREYPVLLISGKYPVMSRRKYLRDWPGLISSLDCLIDAMKE